MTGLNIGDDMTTISMQWEIRRGFEAQIEQQKQTNLLLATIGTALAEEAKRDDLHCDFCAKDNSAVFLVQRGFGGHYICDECVALAARIIEDRRKEENR
jgi:hypothetical protein